MIRAPELTANRAVQAKYGNVSVEVELTKSGNSLTMRMGSWTWFRLHHALQNSTWKGAGCSSRVLCIEHLRLPEPQLGRATFFMMKQSLGVRTMYIDSYMRNTTWSLTQNIHSLLYLYLGRHMSFSKSGPLYCVLLRRGYHIREYWASIVAPRVTFSSPSFSRICKSNSYFTMQDALF